MFRNVSFSILFYPARQFDTLEGEKCRQCSAGRDVCATSHGNGAAGRTTKATEKLTVVVVLQSLSDRATTTLG